MKKIITFCGHANFHKAQEYEQQLIDILERETRDCTAEMYLGGYGNFDEFAYQCCLSLKHTHNNISLIFVTPYITESYQRNQLIQYAEKYDCILYPEIEDKPLKYAINYRNRYMVDKADLVIAFVDHTWGGAYQTYQYATRKKKRILNIGKL